MSRTAAQALADRLADLGARFAFGIPGGPIVHVFHALMTSERIRFVLSQHEAGAAFAAMGAAFTRGPREVPICLATAGPGATNLITGVAAADHERVPLLVITGNVATHLRGRGAVQDSSRGALDIVRMLEPITARSVTVDDPEALLPIAEELYELALSTLRPVHLDVPVDVSARRLQTRPPAPPSPGASRSPRPSSTAAREDLREVLQRFLAAERPVVFAGNGVKLAGRRQELQAIAERHRLPVIVSAHGKGTFDERHPLYAGAFGFGAGPEGTRFLEDHRPDACLFLCTSLGESSTGAWSPLLTGIPWKAQIDRDPSRMGRGFPVEHAIAADVGEAFAVLVEEPSRTSSAGSSAYPPFPALKAARPESDGDHHADRDVHPRALLRSIQRSLPPRCRIVSDIGNCMLWSIQELTLSGDQSFFVPLGLGSMGSGIGAAVGLAVTSPSTPTLCLVGDCAMLMFGGELHTVSVTAGRPLKLVVLNDGGHGTVAAGLDMLGLQGADVRFPQRVDFAGFARALRFDAHVVKNHGDLAGFDWGSFWSAPTPSLVDVHVDPSVPPPLGLRIKGLGVPGLVA